MNLCMVIKLTTLHYSDPVFNKTTKNRSYRHVCLKMFCFLHHWSSLVATFLSFP